MIAGQLALTVAARFAGAALHMDFVEQPARLALDHCARLTQWQPAYRRAFALQAPLALPGGRSDLLAWWRSGRWPWLLGAVVLVSNWPYTLLGDHADQPQAHGHATPPAPGRKRVA